MQHRVSIDLLEPSQLITGLPRHLPLSRAILAGRPSRMVLLLVSTEFSLDPGQTGHNLGANVRNLIMEALALGLFEVEVADHSTKALSLC
ncbi:hypothetical protein NDU88_007480 [Pleurodeles waltl]|uniref:Uncharacterized protein n=1 Tax=Pleurodeles waltl TaxID=8319 RepID=A0AAV7PQD4_PLEWA|nr:hypothetical protein NDU88_007480 [Pleurodeles waltl]